LVSTNLMGSVEVMPGVMTRSIGPLKEHFEALFGIHLKWNWHLGSD